MDIIIVGKKSHKHSDVPVVVYCGQSRDEAAAAVEEAGEKFGRYYSVNPEPHTPIRHPIAVKIDAEARARHTVKVKAAQADARKAADAKAAEEKARIEAEQSAAEKRAAEGKAAQEAANKRQAELAEKRGGANAQPPRAARTSRKAKAPKAQPEAPSDSPKES